MILVHVNFVGCLKSQPARLTDLKLQSVVFCKFLADVCFWHRFGDKYSSGIEFLEGWLGCLGLAEGFWGSAMALIVCTCLNEPSCALCGT